MNDVRKLIYTTIIAFLATLVVWITALLFWSCGFSFECARASQIVERTPVPTLIPASHVDSSMGGAADEFDKCQVSATELIGAWVSAGAPESEAFPFTDMNGKDCEATYRDIQPLFVENGQWYANAIGCVSCHNSALTARSGGLDLSSYDAMQLGSQRADATATGNNIFGNGNWEDSTLFAVLTTQGMVPTGHSADVSPNNFAFYVGSAVEVTATPTP
ncbi:MAG: hypothetical protein CNIPEHKO_00697 [Anaerolineales bacterium]|nr:hypothetical protein [Anaerolineae bacterium]MBV6400412.1 hypothetical protein [Anaerolineales bacterium]MCC7189704.1 hypothetical protein [Anaerolineales bacterium]